VGNDGGPSGDASNNDGGVTGDGGTLGGLSQCTDATLFSGNPYFTGDLKGWNPAGQEKLADPPLRGENIAVAGQTVFYNSDSEIWRTDGTKVVRLAGDDNEPDTQYNPSGACAAVRVINAKGMTTLPNGNVIVSDLRGGGFIELQNPTGNCNAAPYAGNQVKTLDTDISGDVANEGDVDGPGATAKFRGITLPVSDAQGNLYFDDNGNSKIKKIANDAAHTVSTLYKYGPADPQPLPLALVTLNGKLYVAGGTIISDFLWEIDTQSGTQKTVFTGKGDRYPELDPAQTATIVAIATDGQSLFVGSDKGYIWKIGTDGKYLATIAGKGQIVDFPAGLDLTKPIAVNQLPLKAIGVNAGSMVRMGNDLLWAGRNGVGYHVWSVHCQ
jgi:hypothetical protein